MLMVVFSSSRSDEETHDHIGSTSTTPSGVATPNPNPADKRLPGIIHSYFGQVGARSFTSPHHQELFDLPCPATDRTVATHTSVEMCGIPPGTLPTAPNSPNLEQSMRRHDNSAPRHQCSESSNLVAHDVGFLAPPYPTPPASSPASLRGKGLDGSYDSGELSVEISESNDASAFSRKEDGFSQSRPSIKRHRSGNDVVPLRICRRSSGLTPLSNVMSCSSVYASNLSNPAIQLSTTSNTPTRHLSSVSALSSLTSLIELAKLTDGVAAPPLIKNTPPLTPRALSNDGIDNTKKLPPPLSTPQSEDPSSSIDKSNAVTTNASTAPSSTAPVGPPKGKLSIKIIEARGLRPSHDPFVVCVFEWNESIAKGPKHEEAAVDKDEGRGKEDLLGGVPIKRSGSDMGRSMAIPMKSRQSSTTSLSDHKNFKSGRQLTDPRWDHEAVLYAQPFRHLVNGPNLVVVMFLERTLILTSMYTIDQIMKPFWAMSRYFLT